MKEPQLRSWHRKSGVAVIIFVMLQALTGIVLTVEDIFGFYLGGIVHDLHMWFGTAGHIHRLIAGIGMLWMSLTGLVILMKMRARKKKTKA